jgi:transposase
MLSFPGSLRIFIALQPCDMRKGFDGLAALVSEQLKEDVRSGALFIFTNRRRARLKILYWDGSGLWLMTKRLEQGTFAWPRSAQGGQVKLQLAPEALAMLTDGIDLHGASPRGWYERDSTKKVARSGLTA